MQCTARRHVAVNSTRCGRTIAVRISATATAWCTARRSARRIARHLGLDEDLTEALALAHDLGHPPFGHAGESGLNEALAAYGGFDHNAQSLRVVTFLEHRYAAFDGL